MNNTLYPASPIINKENAIAPSAAFRKQAYRVVFSILLFFVVYLLLIIAAFLLAAVCFYGAFLVVLFHPSFLTIILGLGLAATGISVIFFLIKFIFAITRDQNPARVEIFEQDQPALFAFIRQLTAETATPFPKKIFISPDVNAGVFYNSSFWSMLLPVKKNLEIGLGLVNSINISEFKAVMAHEFGHFSQRSMKLGSFTYNVNRIIYNMLYENSGYTGFLHSWGSINSYLAFFAQLTIKIAEGIQSVLKEMYKFINKSYFGLSREMEFHADAIAASVAGGNNLISGLSRVEIAGSCYNTALNKADECLKQNKISKNIFSNQLTLLRSFADDFKLPQRDGLPEISYHFITSFSKSRVNYKNQWASHPTLEERKIHLDGLNINVEAVQTKAWEIFSNPTGLQEQLTENLYKSVKLEREAEIFDESYFDEMNKKDKDRYTLPDGYKGFYDGRFVNPEGWNLNELVKEHPAMTFDALFTEENAQLQPGIKRNEADIEIIKAIRDRQIDTKSFDFDGVKYKVADCDAILSRLNEELSEQKKNLSELDKAAFTFFHHAAGPASDIVTDSYQRYQLVCEQYDIYVDIANKVINIVTPFYQGKLTKEQIMQIISSFKEGEERRLKEVLKLAIEHHIITTTSNSVLHQAIQEFIQKNNAYFVIDEFRNEELNQLRDIVYRVADEWNEYRFQQYKQLLEDQLKYYDAAH